MVSRKNIWNKQKQITDKHQRFAIKKLTVGVASVLIGTTFFGIGSGASADQISNADGDTGHEKHLKEGTEEVQPVQAAQVDVDGLSNQDSGSQDESVKPEDATETDATNEINSGSDILNEDDSQDVDKTTESAVEKAQIEDQRKTVDAPNTDENVGQEDKFQEVENKVDAQSVDLSNDDQNELSDDANDFETTSFQVGETLKATSLFRNAQPLAENKVVASQNGPVITLNDGSKLTFDKNIFDGKMNDSISATFTSSSFKAGDVYVISVPSAFVDSVDAAGLPAALGSTNVTQTDKEIQIINTFTASGNVSQNVVFKRAPIRNGSTSIEDPSPSKEYQFNTSVKKTKGEDQDEKSAQLIFKVPSTLTGGDPSQNVPLVLTPNPSNAKYNNVSYPYAVYYRGAKLRNPGDTTSLMWDESLKMSTENIQIKISVPEYFEVDRSVHAKTSIGYDLGVPQQAGIGQDVIINIDKDTLLNRTSIDVSFLALVFNGIMRVPQDMLGGTIVKVFKSQGPSTIQFTFNDGSKQSLPDFTFNEVRINPKQYDNTSGSRLQVTKFDSGNYLHGNQKDDVPGDKSTGSLTGAFDLVNVSDASVKDASFVYEVPDGISVKADHLVTRSDMPVSFEVYDQHYEFTDGTTFDGNIKDSPDKNKELKKYSFKVRDLHPGERMSIRMTYYSIKDQYSDGTPLAAGDVLSAKLTTNNDEWVFSKTTLYPEPKKIDTISQSGFLNNSTSVVPDRYAPSFDFAWQTALPSSTVSNEIKDPIAYVSVPDMVNINDLKNVIRVGNQNYTPELVEIAGKRFLKVTLPSAKNDIHIRLSNYNRELTVSPDAVNAEQDYYAFLVTGNDYSSDGSNVGPTKTILGTETDKMDQFQKDVVNALIAGGAEAKSIVTGNKLTFNVLVSEGTSAFEQSKGNLDNDISKDSHNDVYIGDTFELTHSLVNSSKNPVSNVKSFVNIPGTYDGTSRFDSQLTGPVEVINTLTGQPITPGLTVKYSTEPVSIDKNNRQSLDGYVTADQVNDWSQIKSYVLVFDRLESNQSVRSIATVKDPQSYLHAGKSVNSSSLSYADSLDPFVIKASDQGSAKVTLQGTATVHTQIKYTDKDGQVQVIPVGLDKLYDLSKGLTLNKDNFLTTDNYQQFVPEELIPEGYIIDLDDPTVENSKDTYRDGFANGTAQFGQKIGYDANNDVVTYTLKAKTQTETNEVNTSRNVYFKYFDKAAQKAWNDQGLENADKDAQTVFLENLRDVKAVVSETINGTETKIIDAVTGQVVETSYTWDKDEFSPLQSPEVNGWTPNHNDIPAIQKDDFAINSVTNLFVLYTPNSQTAKVIYIDDTTGKELKSDSISGFTDEAIDYQTAPTIEDYESKGYELDSDDFPVGVTYDDKDDQDGPTQVYEVHLKHAIEKDAKYQDETVTRTITYKRADNGEEVFDRETQIVTFHRTGDRDNATGQIMWNEWTPQQMLDAVDSPTLKGFTPDKAQVDAINVNHDSEDINEVVLYSPNESTIEFNYIDETTGNRLHQDNVTGKTSEHSDYTTESNINKYTSEGYDFVKDETNGVDLTFSDEGHLVYNIYFKHGTEEVSEKEEVNRTIHYVDDKGNKLFDDVSQTSHFDRTGTKDKVTEKITWNDWNSDDATMNLVVSPDKKGYTASQKEVPQITTNANDKDQVVTVVYAPDRGSLIVNYIDDITGVILHTDVQDGESDQDTGYTTTDKINSYKDQGYELVSDDTDGKSLVISPEGTKTYNVHLTHGKESADDSKTVNRLVHYQYEDGSKAFDDFVYEPITFNRTGVKDKVTGDIDWNEWDESHITSPSHESPELDGYTPDKAQVNSIDITPSMGDIEETVIYKSNAQKGYIRFIDDDLGSTMTDFNSEGKFGDKITFEKDIPELIKQFEDAGYVLVSNDFSGDETYQSDDNKNMFQVHFRHKHEEVEKEVPVERHISYIDEETGEPVSDSVTQTVTFKIKGDKDVITGQINWDNVDLQEFPEVVSPKVDGYLDPDILTVETQQVTPEDKDSEVVVKYKKVKEEVPETPAPTPEGPKEETSTPEEPKQETPEKVTPAKETPVVETPQKAQPQEAPQVGGAQPELPQMGDNDNKALAKGSALLGLASIATGLGLAGATKRKKTEKR